MNTSLTNQDARYNTSNMQKLWMLLALLIIIWGNIAQASVEYRFERKWPQLEQPWYFSNLTAVAGAIAIAPDGSVYVADTDFNRIQHFNGEGVFIGQWGHDGSGDGQFNEPSDIAIAADGSVYVADFRNNRIQHFTATGVYVGQWGSEGSGSGQLSNPKGLAIAGDGSVYVADSGNDRIQHFSGDGVFLGQWGSKGSGDGRFEFPTDIATAADGSFYVVDIYNHRVQHFNADGVYLNQWGSKGKGVGLFYYPQGIAMASDGSVYVVESDNHRVQHFSAAGVYLGQWGHFGSNAGQFKFPAGIAIAADDSVYVVDTTNFRIQHFTARGTYINQWGSLGNAAGQFNFPEDAAIADDNSVYMADTNNHRIQHFSVAGEYLGQWGKFGGGTGQFKYPSNIAITADGIIYVADTDNHRIQYFNAAGDFLGQWGSKGLGDGRLNYPSNIAIAADGSVYVVDTKGVFILDNNNRIQHFTATGEYLGRWDNQGDGHNYEDLAIAPDGSLYLADSDNHHIQHFSPEGRYLGQWGHGGTGNGQLNYPQGLTVAPDGSVYVADSENDRIQHFDKDGAFLEKWGATGTGEGQFYNPEAIAIAPDGNIYVTDTFNSRLQAFKPINNPDHSKAIIVSGGELDNELWPAAQLNANYAYRTLRSQGYNKDEIRYLSHNTQQDMDFNGKMDDIAAVPGKASLKSALLKWTRASDTDNLMLYLVDHGGDGTFRLSDHETLSTAQLDSWLDQLESDIPTLKQITLIIDACESGSFIKPVNKGVATLAGAKRRIITSAQALQNAYFLTQGTVSFSNYFWTHLFHGNDLRSAFDHASQVMGAYQSPQVDFNGNGISNESEDFALLNNQYIGNGVGASSSAPDISDVKASPSVLPLAGGQSTVSAKVTDGDGVLEAYAIVRPPNFDPGAANQTITELPKIVLNYNSESKRYESYGYWQSNTQGDYRFTAGGYPFDHPGTYVLTLYAQDLNYNAAEPKQATVTVATNKKRRAVIVEGYGASRELAASFKDNAKLAYDALAREGYADDDIYYLSASGLSGVDATATAANLQYALSQWHLNGSEDLTVYLIADRFEMDNAPGLLLSVSDSVTLSQLKQWLDIRQKSPSFNQSTGLPYSGLVTVILDACNSGEILNALKGNRRILISSTTPDGAAHFTNHSLLDGQSFSTELSFSRVFWQKVQHGANLRDTLSAAGNAVNQIAGVQTPQLDDNFNGIGNDAGGEGLAKDGDLARKFSLGYGVFAAEDQPRILDHTPSGDVAGGQIDLDMLIASTSTISDAWAIIARPDYSPDCSAYDQLPKLHLRQDPKNPRHWTGSYNKLNLNGDYKVTFYAIDQNAQQSQPATAVLTRTTAAPITEGGATAGLFEPNNSPGQASFSIVNGQPKTLAIETTDDQDWVSFYAQQGQTYTVEANNLGADIDLGLQLYNAQGQQLKPSLSNSVIDAGGVGEREIFDWQAPANGLYYIKVSNSGHSTGTDNSYQLHIYIAYGTQIGLVKGSITDSCDGTALGGVQISAEDSGDYTESHSSGVYGLPLSAEAGGSSYHIDINALGYQAQSVTLTLMPSQTIPMDIILSPVTACPTTPTILPPNSVIDGGSFDTTLQGTPGAPATLTHANIGSNAILSHVIVSDGSVVDAHATLKEGVRFTDNALVPAGIDLSQALSAVPNVIPASIDLHQDVTTPSTLLQQLQKTNALKAKHISQDDQGLVRFKIGSKQYLVRPVSVRQAISGTKPGLRYSNQGTLEIVTKVGRVISFISTVNAPEVFNQSLGTLGLSLDNTEPGNGNLAIGKPDQPAYTVIRPALYSTLADKTSPLGLQQRPHPELKNSPLFNLVFEQPKQSGKHWQQALYPVPKDWDALGGYLRQHGYQNILLNPDGILQFEQNQKRYRGLMGYAVDIGDQAGELRFETAGDINQDGQDDFWVVYPEGRRQQLFLLPVSEIP